jgi:macrolide transport system ATP-binding/permease protein
MGTMLADVRHGLRQLRRQPLFAAAAIGSLALGIGLNTTLFSVVNAVLFREGVVTAPEQLVEIYTGLSKDFPQLTTSYPDYQDIRSGTTALQSIAANAYVRGILSTAQRGVLVTGEAVTSSYFDVLGIRLPLGRGFRPDEDRSPGTAAVAVLSDALWRERFGQRPDIVGEPVTLSGVPYTVIGVAPAAFTGTLPGIPTELWVPVTMIEHLQFSGVQASADDDPGTTRLDRRGTRWLFVKGRLADGHSADEARTQIETIYSRLRAAYPITNKDVTASVVPASSVRFHPMLDGYLRAASAGLLAAVGLVLLIACANVANMLLARGASRRRELAVRAAIGASRRRLVGQLLAESMLLAIIGGSIGLLIAWWAGQLLSGIGSDVFPMPIRFEFSIDRLVLIFAVVTSIVTAVLFGLAPAWSSSRPELVPALKDSGAANGRRRTSVRNLLVVGQLALSLILLVSGALLTRGLVTAQNTDLGFDPGPISSLSFDLQMNGYDRERAVVFRDRAFQTLSALPGVTAVSTASRLPLAPDINMDSVNVPGHHAPDEDGLPIDTVSVGSDYFAVVGVPLVAGRAFTADEIRAERRLAIVNETMAKQFWPDGSAVGRVIRMGGKRPVEIIGIARDHKVRSVGEAPRPYLHVPAGPSQSIGLVVRTTMPAASALPTLRNALWTLEPNIVFTEDVPAQQVADTTVAPTRIGAMVLMAFGGLALGLAAIGVYGVIAFSVSRRTREVGIRMALGAERGQVLRMVLSQGLRLAGAGIALGAFASAGVSRLLESMLYGVSGFDPLAYVAAAGVLLLIAGAANLVPAITASRIDPVRALRSE